MVTSLRYSELKDFQIKYKSKRDFLKELSEREVSVLRTIALQLKLDILKGLNPKLSSEKLNSTRIELSEISDKEVEKIIRYYSFLRKLWNEFDYYKLIS